MARTFAPPAVAIGAERARAILSNQGCARILFTAIIIAAVFAAAYFFARAPLALDVLIILTGIALAAAVGRLRGFGERYRMIQRIRPVMRDDEAALLAAGIRAESRRVLLLWIVTFLLLAATIAWSLAAHARVLVAIASILLLGYLCSSIKPVAGGTAPFAALGQQARASGCRITLFRSFADGPSRLTRNLLLPIVAGYGDMHIVFDRSLGAAPRETFLGEDIPDLESIATVHRFQDADWQTGVAELIAETDIAIIEATRLTPGVIWEFARCMKNLPPWRVYPVLDLEGLGDTPVKKHLADFYELVAREPEMPHDVGTRWFFLGPGAFQAETLAADVHARMIAVMHIEMGMQDPSLFGEGAARWLVRT